MTALHFGLIVMLLQSEVSNNIRCNPSEATFSHYAKIKEAISPVTLTILLLLNNIHVLALFLWTGIYVRPSNCCAIATAI